MTDFPIIFSGPMIRALLDGRKTMTRRMAWREFIKAEHSRNGRAIMVPSPWQRVKLGDRLWVREVLIPGNCGFDYATPDDDCIDLSDLTDEQVEFWNKRAGHEPDDSPRISPIHMPRWASRLTLVVTATKIERLQDISIADAIAEGCGVDFDHPHPELTRETFPAERFRDLWNSLHGFASWDANPEVVALTFKVHKANIDAMPKEIAA